MKRREFITLLGGAAVLWPLAAHAQQPAKLPTVGFFGSGTPPSQKRVADAFIQRLTERGWTDGRNVNVVFRWAGGAPEKFREIASEFTEINVDVIVASGATSTTAAKSATALIPIVFAVVNDPLGTGIVPSLSRPGGNVTGLSLQSPDLAGKRVELLREAVPTLRRLAIMANTENPGASLEGNEVEAIARSLHLVVARVGIRQAEEIDTAFDSATRQADALYVCSDALAIANRSRIAALQLEKRLPTMHGLREYAEAGGLMSYGADNADLFRRAADYVDKILHGARPGDLPVEQPTRFELVINMKTAGALGLEIPQTLLAIAEEVIE